MNDRFESLEDGEVISVQHDSQVLSGHRTFRAGELSETLEKLLESAIPGWNEEKRDWLTAQGIDCEALRFGSKGWEKGRIRFALQFCPDEPIAAQESISSRSNSDTKQLPAEQTIGSLAAAAEIQPEDMIPSAQQPVSSIINNSSAPASNDRNLPETLIAAIPVAGVAMSAAAATAVATPDLLEVSTNSTIPHHTDTVLELEDGHTDSTAPNSGGLDEISFDFDSANKDRGRMIPNGGMVLDLNDIGLDFSEHDLLSFEANGLDGADGFGNLQDFDQPENSGMLIDEVWNEMNQNNWPGIN
jgi:KGK domain